MSSTGSSRSQAGDRSCSWATYHAGTLSGIGFQPDVIIECTGVGQVIVDSIQDRGSWWCGVPHGRRERRRTVGLPAADTASNVVLRNNVVVGSVNANKRHWYRGGAVAVAHGPLVAGAPRHAA
jgi:hypothetical protein